MTLQAIKDYVSMEHVDHSKTKLTRVFLKRNEIFTGQFLAANQTEVLMNQNKWVLTVGGDSLILDGDDIDKLKVG